MPFPRLLHAAAGAARGKAGFLRGQAPAPEVVFEQEQVGGEFTLHFAFRALAEQPH